MVQTRNRPNRKKQDLRTHAIFWVVGFLIIIMSGLLIIRWSPQTSDKARGVIEISTTILIVFLGVLLPSFVMAGKKLWKDAQRARGLDQILVLLLLIASIAVLLYWFHFRIVTILVVGNSYGGLEEELREFNRAKRKDGIIAKLVYDFYNQDTNERHDGLRSYLEGKDRADIVELDIIWMKQAISAGRLQPLGLLFERDMTGYDLHQGILDAAKEPYSGKLYGIPLLVDVGLVFYRRDLLGVLPDSVTLDDLDEAIKLTLSKAPNQGLEGFIFQSAQYEGLNCLFFEMLSSKNVNILNDYGSIHINSESVKAIVEQLHDMIYESGSVPPSVLVFKEEQSRELFTSGRALVLRNWPYVLHSWAKSSKIPLKDIGVTNFSRPVLGGYCLGIMQDSKHLEEAWEVVKFLTHPARQSKRATSDNESWRRIPADMKELSDLSSRFPLLSAVEKALTRAQPRPQLQDYQRFSNIMSRALFEILSDANGKKKIGGILDKAQKELEGMTLRLTLFVTEPDSSAGFYSRILGFEKVREQRSEREYSLSMQSGSVNLVLVSPSDSQQQHVEIGGVIIILEIGDIYPYYKHVVNQEYPIDSLLQGQSLDLIDFWLSDPDGHSIRITSQR